MYKLNAHNEKSVTRTEDNAFIPFDPANTDYQAYLVWLGEGNTPEPARPLAPEPDWMGFKADYKSSPTIRAWFAGLDPMDREDLAAMVASQSIDGVAAAMADVDYSAVKSELNDLLALHNIGLILP